MKRKFLFFLLLTLTMFVFSSFADSEKEITFWGVSWLSDDPKVLQMLKESGCIQTYSENYVLQKDQSSFLIEDSALAYRPDTNSEYEEVCFSISTDSFTRGRIAGYPIKNLILSFAYNGTCRLISVKVEMIGADYNQILDKLIQVYGDGQNNKNDEGISAIMWKGADNSAVLLYTESEGLDYTLMYGRLDAEEILKNCLAPADSSDVSGL